ncbi:MAG: hypothetical protein BWZ04_00922 [Firmicutes bacterium ADurb.BinA205]|nr:MAG: hypothetical protein BWZ04_00922 [Firmicutes bacterium ADurb.BinA205]
MKKMKDLSLKQFYKMVIIGEGAVIILLAARMAVRILFGKSALTTALIFIVCVLTFWLIWMIFSHRVEKDDELSEINKMKANLSTFYMMTALVPFGFCFAVMYNIIAGKPLTISIGMDNAADILILLMSVFLFFNSCNFLRLDSDSDGIFDGEDDE